MMLNNTKYTFDIISIDRKLVSDNSSHSSIENCIKEWKKILSDFGHRCSYFIQNEIRSSTRTKLNNYCENIQLKTVYQIILENLLA